ncbi:hypothetical protein RU99_GL002852 [Enterococcus casseliflavus]|nr:hypothetical protein RU99_GL002852 [Enterococcus casseliflavus]
MYRQQPNRSNPRRQRLCHLKEKMFVKNQERFFLFAIISEVT